MKRTKNMIYKPTEESRELLLYATNCGDLYRVYATSIINNLRKKAEKGIYNSDKAVDAWYNVATRASKMYNKDFGYSFSVGDRFTTAVEMEKCYKEEIFFELNK